VSQLRRTFPDYCISKNRIDLSPSMDVDAILNFVKEHYRNERINDRDGVKIDFADGWVHLRKSNTEPIIRIYSEAATMERANALAEQVKQLVNQKA
ncbi:MAG: phosphoglucosamine mutase, partial [Paludibacteraceae bacterium]|nr:phosphoglucosamine mutase [Paludibacteraceae bacterium]